MTGGAVIRFWHCDTKGCGRYQGTFGWEGHLHSEERWRKNALRTKMTSHGTGWEMAFDDGRHYWGKKRITTTTILYATASVVIPNLVLLPTLSSIPTSSFPHLSIPTLSFSFIPNLETMHDHDLLSNRSPLHMLKEYCRNFCGSILGTRGQDCTNPHHKRSMPPCHREGKDADRFCQPMS
jgi:hypothetical protein